MLIASRFIIDRFVVSHEEGEEKPFFPSFLALTLKPFFAEYLYYTHSHVKCIKHQLRVERSHRYKYIYIQTHIRTQILTTEKHAKAHVAHESNGSCLVLFGWMFLQEGGGRERNMMMKTVRNGNYRNGWIFALVTLQWLLWSPVTFFSFQPQVSFAISLLHDNCSWLGSVTCYMNTKSNL